MTLEQLALSAAEGSERFAAMVRQVDKIELDYSRESVDRLSTLVSSKRAEWLRAMHETQLHRFTELMGCYFGECVRRLHKGSWVWMGQDAAVQVSGISDVHFALPFSNVQSHVQIGDEIARVDLPGLRGVGPRPAHRELMVHGQPTAS